MIDNSRTRLAFAALLPAAMLLNACGEKPAEEVSEPAVTEPTTEPTASIFGPEAELPEKAVEKEELAADLPLKLTIGFPDGGATLDADAVVALEAALPKIKAEESALITLGAHSDSGGNDVGNLTTSEKRGLAVAAWLIERGVDEDRIEVVAFGEQNPLQPNALADGSPNELGRAANRRVEITLANPE
ncbi:MAG: OmpA family protein [Erythrobacter sp.]